MVRCALPFTIDFVFTEIVPLTFYGTKDLDIYSDFFFKRVVVSGLIASLVVSPVENYIQWIFRTPKVVDELQEEPTLGKAELE